MNDAEIARTPVRAAEENNSVRRCCEAGDRAYRIAIAKGANVFEAQHAAEKAYQNAMPPLSGDSNLNDFVACVVHGLLTGVFLESRASKLLYAAQIAGGLQRKQTQPKPAA